MSESSDSTDSYDMEQPIPEASGSGPRNFLIVLIAMAIVPFLMAIGFATWTTAPPAAKLDASEDLDEPKPNQISVETLELQLADQHRSKGDRLFREGKYEAAVKFYNSLGNGDPQQMPPELAIRIAICQEALGFWDEALELMRFIADTPKSPVTTAAILGQARIWLRLNDFEKAEPLLRSLLLESGDRDSIAVEAVPEIIALFAVALAQHVITPEKWDSRETVCSVGNLIQISFANSIGRIETNERSLVLAKPVSPQNSGFPVPAVSSSMDDSDEEVREPTVQERLSRPLAVTDENHSLADVFKLIAKEMELPLKWQDSVRDRATNRVVCPNVIDLPSDLLLTIACREIDATWMIQERPKAIVIAGEPTDSPQSEGLRDMAQVLLNASMKIGRVDPLVNPLKYVSAQIAISQGRTEDAAKIFASLVGRQITPIATYAAYNSAVAYHRMGNLLQAGKMLEFVVHGAPGHEIHTRALILYGRILTDRGLFKEATFQFKRAVTSRSEELAEAVVFGAMALLLSDQPVEAGELIAAHSLYIREFTVRNAAALMTSLSRIRTVSGDSLSREASLLFRSIAANETQADWLGPSGQLLLGQAMIEAGLEDKMAELFSSAIQRGVPVRVEDEMNWNLAEYWNIHQRTADAKAGFSRLYSKEGHLRIKSGLRLAELALDEKDSANCLKICRELMNHNSISKPDLLKLAARAYELDGKLKLAARCYAGEWPIP